MRYFSTFSGIGGFEIGINNAFYKEQVSELEGVRPKGDNLHTTKSGSEDRAEQPTCVGYSEIDKYAIKVYERQFNGQDTNSGELGERLSDAQCLRPNGDSTDSPRESRQNNESITRRHKAYGDITTINADTLPDFDCLVGGFPCQAFSIAGKRKGFDDTRGTLFFDLARILRAKQPRLFVFENVKGLLSHDSGNTIKTIFATLDELGYDIQWQVLNSKNFGVPQNRERIIIVGHLRGTPRPQVFPFRENDNSLTKKNGYQVSESAISGTLTATDAKMHLDGTYIRQLNQPTHSNDRVYGDDGISPALNTMQGGNRQPFVKVPEATKKGYAEASVGQAINLSVPNSKTRRGRVSDIAPTVDTGIQLHTLTEDVKIRRLTPKECERLQGFPDNWTKYGIGDEPISDSQRYKMCGNAVTTNVIQAVFERIFESHA